MVMIRNPSAIHRSWRTPYIGSAHHLLAETIDHLNLDRLSSGFDDNINYLEIVQSSGTGKSRMVYEVAGLKFALVVNVREKRVEESMYPHFAV